MSKPKITPLGDRVLVKHADEDEQVKGGIIIPDSAKEKPQEAEVVARNRKKTRTEMPFHFKSKKAIKSLSANMVEPRLNLTMLNTNLFVKTTSLVSLDDACSPLNK